MTATPESPPTGPTAPAAGPSAGPGPAVARPAGGQSRSISRGALQGAAPKLPPAQPKSAAVLMIALFVCLVCAALASAGTGQLHVPPREVLGSLFHKMGLDLGPMPTHPQGDAVLWNIRFPRLVMGLLVGAALGAAGAVMQGVFRNPLAEPGIIGVSAGAAVGACAVIVYGWTFAGTFTIPAAAFCTALLTTLLVYVLSQRHGRTEVVTLILMGVAVTALAGAAVGWLVFTGDTAAREQIVFWQMGSLNGSRWEQVAIAAPFIAAGTLGTLFMSRRLDLLSLGENAARHLGVNVERVRLTSIVLVTLSVAAAVSFAGIIGFVGLVVPHLIRMAIGPAHRTLVPASAIGGALMLTLADLIARSAIDFADLPIGMITACVGGPFFFYLLIRARNNAGGWA